MLSKTSRIIIVASGSAFIIWGLSFYLLERAVSNIGHQVADNVKKQSEIYSALADKKSGIAGVVALEPDLAKPDLNKPIIVFNAALDEESRRKALKIINDERSELKRNPDLYSSWMQLALYVKLIGDYQGAGKIWHYVASRWADDHTVYNNLANLYIYQLKDNAKAENYLLIAIDKAPYLSQYYANTYEFYRYVIKDFSKAKAILELGIKHDELTAQALRPILQSF